MKYFTRLLAVILISTALVSGTSALASATGGTWAPNPSHNLGSDGALVYSPACSTAPTSVRCTQYVLSRINQARATLHEMPMVLPTNWYHLTIAEQLLVVVNLERLGYHYPPYLGLNGALTHAALTGARRYTDPVVSTGLARAILFGGGAWAGGILTNVLAADYGWMYDDGWGGSRATTWNIACTGPRAPGCWGHRDGLLGWSASLSSGPGFWCTTCVMGAAYAPVGRGSQAVLVAAMVGATPPLYFTWAQETRFFPRGLPAVITPPPPPTTTVPGGSLGLN